MGGITVSDAWVEAPVKEGGEAEIRLTIRNDSGDATKLVIVESEVADRAILHIRVGFGEATEMRPLPAIDLQTGTAERLAGDRHIMLIGLKRSFEVGDTFPLLLTFLKGEKVAVKVRVRAADEGAADATTGRPKG